MKREEKNQQSIHKILSFALREFGEKSYGEASLNAICSEGGISKGILYHYFQDKDALYLACVQECFDRLTAYLSGLTFPREEDVASCIEKYFNARHAFFRHYPLYLGIFSSTGAFAPAHLREQIQAIRAQFDTLNVSILTAQLDKVRLRDGLTTGEVVDFLRSYLDFINGQQRAAGSGIEALQMLEQKRKMAVDLVLYGVIGREKGNE